MCTHQTITSSLVYYLLVKILLNYTVDTNDVHAKEDQNLFLEAIKDIPVLLNQTV